tara:strand:- start:8591 stop:9706 length:1116 start_codon:yes stop_codon:yes gene_type:complete
MRFGLLALVALLVSCSPTGKAIDVAIFERGSFPVTLDAWGVVLIRDGELVPNDRVVPYDLKSALFTDYAHKFRTVYVPEGKSGSGTNILKLPVGSILSKTFYYPKDANGLINSVDLGRSESLDFGERGLALDRVKLIETRLLVHLEDGWVGLPYVWDELGKQATLEITGSEVELSLRTGAGQQSFHYVVPDFNQCQGCHIENLTAGAMAPVGFKSRHLDKPYVHLQKSENQLQRFASLGLIEPVVGQDFSRTVDWQDTSKDLDDRARSYLDINCGHCHNPTGPADTSGMFLSRETTDLLHLGLCKPPVAAGQGTGGRPAGIFPGQPDQSVLVYRMGSLDLGAMMPELGRSLVHQEGVELISNWIESLEGDC